MFKKIGFATLILTALNLANAQMAVFPFSMFGDISSISRTLTQIVAVDDNCPEDFIKQDNLLWDPVSQTSILFKCIKEERRVFQLTQNDGTTVEATAIRLNQSERLQIKELRILYPDHNVKNIISLTLSGMLNREEHYNEQGNLIFKFSREGMKLEKFNNKHEVIASCSYDTETDKIINHYPIDESHIIEEIYSFDSKSTGKHQVTVSKGSRVVFEAIEIEQEAPQEADQVVVVGPEPETEQEEEKPTAVSGYLNLVPPPIDILETCFYSNRHKLVYHNYKLLRKNVTFGEHGATIEQIIEIIKSPTSDLSKSFLEQFQVKE